MADSRFIPLILILALLMSCGGIFYAHQNLESSEPVVGRFIVPPQEAAYLTFGYREIVADLFWIRVVQDFGYCENRDSKKSKLAYDYARVIQRSAEITCDKSWVYQMLDRVTDLDPQFKIAYQAGGTMLSLLVNDPKGAQALFSKGIRQFPTDWNLLYRAAYHQLFEMHNELKAAQYLERSAHNGGSPWFLQLAARLYTKEGKAEVGRLMLDDFSKNHPDMAESKRFKELSAQIDQELKDARTPAEATTPRAKK